MKEHSANVWLVNTGWSGGAYGTGKRVKLSLTRAMIDAIHSGALKDAPSTRDPIFGFDVITECPNVPSEILVPKNTWSDAASYDAAAQKLAVLFKENFKKYESGVSNDVRSAGPR